MNGENDIVEKVQHYVNKHYNEELTLGKIAAILYMNPAYLGRVFRKKTGQSFNDYLVATRIRNAKLMLQRRDMYIGDVAHAVGYESLNYFFKLFKEQTGVTPARYRSDAQQYVPNVNAFSMFDSDFTVSSVLNLDFGSTNPDGGAFLSLSGGLFYVFGLNNKAGTSVCCLCSADDGHTWMNRQLLFETEGIHCSVVSLLRMQDSSVGIFYTETVTDETWLMLRCSYDGLKTFKEAQRLICLSHHCIPDCGSIIRLENKNLLLPVSMRRFTDANDHGTNNSIRFYTSEDDGETWHMNNQVLSLCYRHAENGLQSPALISEENGRLICYCATGLGCQYEACSFDNGKSWTQPHPSMFTSPDSGMGVAKLSNRKRTVVFDPLPDYTGKQAANHSARLICLAEKNDGSWTRPIILENIRPSDGISFAQPTLCPLPDSMLVSYIVIRNGQKQLRMCMIPAALLIPSTHSNDDERESEP